LENEFINVPTGAFNPVDVYEVKILLAYFLNKIERPVTPAQLNEIATGDGVVNYFLYVEAVEQMLKNGTLKLIEDEGTEYYVLTDEGKNGADFKELVNRSTRERIYASGLRLFAKLRAEREMRFEITQQKNGYSVHAVCEDGGITLMDLTLFAPDKEQAEFIKSKILMNPSEFYSKVLDFVIENEEFVPSVSD